MIGRGVGPGKFTGQRGTGDERYPGRGHAACLLRRELATSPLSYWPILCLCCPVTSSSLFPPAWRVFRLFRWGCQGQAWDTPGHGEGHITTPPAQPPGAGHQSCPYQSEAACRLSSVRVSASKNRLVRGDSWGQPAWQPHPAQENTVNCPGSLSQSCLFQQNT